MAFKKTIHEGMARALTKTQRIRVGLKRAKSEEPDEAYRGFLLLLAELDKLSTLALAPSFNGLGYTPQQMTDEIHLVIRNVIKRQRQASTTFERRVYLEIRRHLNAKLLAKSKNNVDGEPTPIPVDGIYVFYNLD